MVSLKYINQSIILGLLNFVHRDTKNEKKLYYI